MSRKSEDNNAKSIVKKITSHGKNFSKFIFSSEKLSPNDFISKP